MQYHIREICSALKDILNDQTLNTNDTDHKRITNFLQGCFNAKKIVRNDLLDLFPPNTKKVNCVLDHLIDPPSNISIYKILLPVAAVIALAALAYKWWSKKSLDADTESEIDDQTAINDKDEIAQPL